MATISSPGVTSPTGLRVPLRGLSKPALQDAYNALWTDFNRFRQDVIDLIREHERCSGCAEGKNDALESLGLPTMKFRKRVTVEVEIDPGSIDPDYTEDAVYDAISDARGITDVYVVKCEDAE